MTIRKEITFTSLNAPSFIIATNLKLLIILSSFYSCEFHFWYMLFCIFYTNDEVSFHLQGSLKSKQLNYSDELKR